MALHAPAIGGLDWKDADGGAPHGRRLGTALLLALALHALAFLLAGLLPWRAQSGQRPPLAITLQRDARPVLPAAPRLRELPDTAPLAPPDLSPELQAPARPAVPLRPAAPAQPRNAVRSPSASPTTTARSDPPPAPIAVFGMDGRLALPPGVLDAGPEQPSWVQAPRERMPWEQRVDPLVYEPTVFEPMWKPDGETLLGELFRRSTVTRTFKLPDGTRVTCSWVLIVGGCGW